MSDDPDHVDPILPTAWYLQRYTCVCILWESPKDVWWKREHYTLCRYCTDEYAAAVAASQKGQKQDNLEIRLGPNSFLTKDDRVFVCTNDNVLPNTALQTQATHLQVWQHYTRQEPIDLTVKVVPPLQSGPPWALGAFCTDIDVYEITRGRWKKRDHNCLTRYRNQPIDISFQEQAGSITDLIDYQLGADAPLFTPADALYVCVQDEIVATQPLGSVKRTQNWENFARYKDFDPNTVEEDAP